MTNTGQIPPPPPKTSSGTTTPEQAPVTETEETIIPTETVTVKKLALRLEKLIREIKLEGEVIRVDTQNKEIYIKTPKGEIIVSFPVSENKTPPQISYGQTVTITLPAGTPPQTAELQIIPIAEQPIEKNTETVKAETTVPITTNPPLQIPPLQINNKITAIIINSPITSSSDITIAATKATSQEIKPDTLIPNTLISVTDLLPNIAKQSLQQITPAKLNNISIQETTNLSHLENKIFQIEIKEINLQVSPIDRTILPEQNANINTKENSIPVITGIVTDYTPANMPIITIQSKNQLIPASTDIVLQTPAPIAKGTVIQFTAEPITPEQYIQQLQIPPIATRAAETLLPSSLQPLTSLTWPALQEAIKISNEIAIPSLATALHNTTPSPSSPTKLIPTVMFFLAALRMGSIENWLGEKQLETLRQAGRRDLISRLSKDFGNISRQSQETISGDWRGVSIPLLNNEEIKMIQLFTKQQNDSEQNEDKENTDKTTRFVLNLKLSQMGSIQLDGFLRHKKTLDLYLRTNNTLPADIKQNLLKAFNLGLEQAGLEAGQMIFQNNPEKLVHIETKPTEMTV